MRIFAFMPFWLMLFFFTFPFQGCQQGGHPVVQPPRDLPQIIARGSIVAVTQFNSTDYFIFRGEPMGFQFDLLQAYAAHLGVNLEIIAVHSPKEAFRMLREGEVDVIANQLIPQGVELGAAFTHPIASAPHVLVQRAPDASSTHVTCPMGLASRVVYVRSGCPSAQRLRELSGQIVVVEMKNYDADQLIELVSTGRIDFAVTDQAVARVNAFHHGNIDAQVVVGPERGMVWAVSERSPLLLQSLNQWFSAFTGTAEYRIAWSKYFDNPFWARRILGELALVRQGRLSAFDERFREASQSIDWDWRLFASLVYQESRFTHNVMSHMGAFGLMQFMPSTADFFGISHDADPYTQIKAGARYLHWLEQRFDCPEIAPEERVKFILASYNAGIGHVIDARNLARKHGRDPHVWDDNVAYFILNNSDYYTDPVVRHGRVRGIETYNYVTQILSRYQHYRNILPQ